MDGIKYYDAAGTSLSGLSARHPGPRSKRREFLRRQGLVLKQQLGSLLQVLPPGGQQLHGAGKGSLDDLTHGKVDLPGRGFTDLAAFDRRVAEKCLMRKRVGPLAEHLRHAIARDHLKRDLEAVGVTDDELKAIDKEIRAVVADAADFAEETPEPDLAQLYSDILVGRY